MSGYNRNRTLQEQWSGLRLNLFPIEILFEPISSHDGDPAMSDDEVCGLFRFGGAVLFELEWFVLLLMLTSLFPSLALKTFSASSNKHIIGAFTTRLSAFAGFRAFPEHVVKLQASKTQPILREELSSLGWRIFLKYTEGTKHKMVFQLLKQGQKLW